MFDIDICLAFLTNTAAKKVSDNFNERLLKLGISKVQWTALYYLGKYDDMSQIELSKLMDIKPSTVARLLDRMEEQALIKRVKNVSDKRITKIEITEEGIKYRDNILPECEKFSKLIAKDISDENIEIFKKVLNKMLENIE